MFKYPFDTKFLIMKFIVDSYLAKYRPNVISEGAGMAIAGLASAASAGGSMIVQGNMNRKNRKWQERMYAQRIKDERENWNMTNQYNEEMYNKYNSPAAQVRQYLDAGVNPDLSESVDSSGLGAANSIGDAGDQGSAPYQSSGVNFIGAFANVMDILNGIESANLDNQLKKAQLDKLSKSAAMDYLVRNYQPRLFDSGIVVDDMPSPSRKALISYFRSQGLSRKAAAQSANFVSSANHNDVKAEYYLRAHAGESNRKQFLDDVSNPYYSDFDDTFSDDLRTYYKGLQDIQDMLGKSKKSKAKFENDYWSARNGRSSGAIAGENEEYGRDINKYSAAIQENQGKAESEINGYLDKLSRTHPKTAVALRVAYMALKNMSVGFKGNGFSLGL